MSARAYVPRRQSARWLDGDCPRGVLAIYDDPRTMDRYTVIYADVNTNGRDVWLDYLGTSEGLGVSAHGEFSPGEARAYRYANRHRAARWTDLPDAVRRAVRRDLEANR